MNKKMDDSTSKIKPIRHSLAAKTLSSTIMSCVTVWLGILEISTGKMTCANAGHEYHG